MKQNDDSRSISEADRSFGRLEFDELVQHLATGYQNAQSAARFVDTKAGAVIAAVPAVLALLTSVLARVLHVPAEWFLLHGTRDWFFCVCLLLAGGYAICVCVVSLRTLFAAFNTITPRHTGEARPSLLFPFGFTECDSRLTVVIERRVRADLLDDYRSQLNRMAQINQEKIACASRAIANLKTLILISLISILVAIVMLLVVAATGVSS